jgi:hypothetical protein
MKKSITIGWTKSDRASGYSSFDGYRPGAEQHTETIEVDVPATGRWDAERLADHVYEAMNAPASPSVFGSVPEQIREAIAATGYRGEGAHYTFSVGDTVTVDGVTVACGRVGWQRVELVAA